MTDDDKFTPSKNERDIEEGFTESSPSLTGLEQADDDKECPIPFVMMPESRSADDKGKKAQFPPQQPPGQSGVEQIDDDEAAPLPFVTTATSDELMKKALKESTVSPCNEETQSQQRIPGPEHIIDDDAPLVPSSLGAQSMNSPDMKAKSSTSRWFGGGRWWRGLSSPTGLEEVGGGEAGPRPFSMELESIKDSKENRKIAASQTRTLTSIRTPRVASQGLEELDDEVRPPYLTNCNGSVKEKAALEQIVEFDTPQDGFKSEEEAGDLADKKPASQFRSHLPGIIFSRNEEEAQENESNHKRGPSGSSHHQDEECLVDVNLGIEQARPREISPGDTANPPQDQERVLNADVQPYHEEGVDYTVPEAYTVKEPETYLAEQIPPWWKQRRSKFLLSLICLLVIVAIVAALVRPSPEPMVITHNNTGSAVELLPCPGRVLANKQKLGMFEVDPYIPRVVMDGRNAMAVAHGPDANSDFKVVFYSLTVDGWERTSVFTEYSLDQFYIQGAYSSAMSGRTALVGLWKIDENVGGEAGVVDVYTQDDVGLWRKMKDPLRPDHEGTLYTWFGSSVDVDGSVACVVAALEGAVYIFEQQANDEWAQVDKVLFGQTIWECFIAGTTLAVQSVDKNYNFDKLHIFRYDQEEKRLKSLQDPLPIKNAFVLNENYLIYSIGKASVSGGFSYYGVSIYHRQDEQDPYLPLQFLNASDYDSMFGENLALDRDILIVSAHNATVIFSEYYYYWAEALILERSYMSYQISGQNIIAVGLFEEILPEDLRQWLDQDSEELLPEDLEEGLDDISYEIHAFNIKDCVQQTANTQMPSNTTPTTNSSIDGPCYTIQVEVLFDWLPGSTSWDIQKLVATENGDDVLVISYTGSWRDFSRVKLWPVCLEEGHYQFTIYSNGGDGICCMHGEGGYNLTTPLGDNIAHGGAFGYNETTFFDVPYGYVPATPTTSSPIQVMASLPTPIISTTSSSKPPKICHWVEVNILTDSYPWQTSWIISRVTTVGGTKEVNIIYGSKPIIELQADGRPFNADHFENSTSDTAVYGALCNCGLGTALCKCGEKVCLIERGDISFYEKIANCEVGGGLAAVIYNNRKETGQLYTLYPESADIPAAFISQDDGKYLLENSIGHDIDMTVSGSLPMEANVLNSERVCLYEGQYQFTIRDTGGYGVYGGICCWYGKGEYSVSSAGKVITQGGIFQNNETTLFNIP